MSVNDTIQLTGGGSFESWSYFVGVNRLQFSANGSDVHLNTGDISVIGGTLTATGFTVTDLNDAPTGISLSPATVAENALGVTVGALTVNDPDINNGLETHTYSLVTGDGAADNALFKIDGTQLKLQDGMVFDFESNPTSSVRVQVTDAWGLTHQEALTITVTNVNEAPEITSNGGGPTVAIPVAENTQP
ncbi:cadherin repeat domain-containing protein [Mesorhizobium sp. A623]